MRFAETTAHVCDIPHRLAYDIDPHAPVYLVHALHIRKTDNAGVPRITGFRTGVTEGI